MNPRFDFAPAPHVGHLLADGRAVIIRPMAARDAALAADFLRGLSPQTRYMRFLSARHASAIELEKWMRIDGDRAVALLAETRGRAGRRELADVRFIRDGAGSSAAELALVVADDAQRQGLGAALLRALIAVATDMGIERLHGTTLHDNVAMRALARRFGFRARRREAGDGDIRLERALARGAFDGGPGELTHQSSHNKP